jgi:hypothetical protein
MARRVAGIEGKHALEETQRAERGNPFLLV